MKNVLRAGVAALVLMAGGMQMQAQLAQQPKPPAHPYSRKHLYDEQADPQALIDAGLKQAKAEHKRVILDFGGDWCGDCQVLDIYFHDDMNLALFQKYVVVHLFVPTTMDGATTPVAAKYGIPIKKGVPALAVLTPAGKVIYSQQTGEFEDMRHMGVESVHEFLDKWKA